MTKVIKHIVMYDINNPIRVEKNPIATFKNVLGLSLNNAKPSNKKIPEKQLSINPIIIINSMYSPI